MSQLVFLSWWHCFYQFPSLFCIFFFFPPLCFSRDGYLHFEQLQVFLDNNILLISLYEALLFFEVTVCSFCKCIVKGLFKGCFSLAVLCIVWLSNKKCWHSKVLREWLIVRQYGLESPFDKSRINNWLPSSGYVHMLIQILPCSCRTRRILIIVWPAYIFLSQQIKYL